MVKKIFFLIGFSVFFSSCDWFNGNERFKFVTESIERSSSDCISDSCVVVSLNFIKCKKPVDFANKFNDTIHKRLLSILQINNDSMLYYADIDKAISLYFSDFKSIREKFPEDISYELNVMDSISFQNDTIVSVASSVYADTGGAHGYSSVEYLNFKPNGECYTNEELFTNIDSITYIAEQYFRKTEKITTTSINKNGYWFEGDAFMLPKNIGFVKDSLVLHYNPYEITSYNQGAIVVKIPLDKIKKWIFFE